MENPKIISLSHVLCDRFFLYSPPQMKRGLQKFFIIHLLLARSIINVTLKLTTMKLIKSLLMIAIVGMVAMSCGETKKEATDAAGDAVEAVQDAAETTADAVEEGADATADAVEEAVDSVKAGAEKLVDSAQAMVEAPAQN